MVRSKRNNKAVIILSFIICPILALPQIIRELYKGNLRALNYLTFFMSLMAFLWIPSGDLYRFYLEYDNIKSLSFNEVWEYSSFDFLMQYAMFLFSKIGLNFEWFRFLTCILEYTLVFSVLKKCIACNNYGKDNATSFKLIIITFGILRFTVFLTGARFTLSLAIMIYSIYKIFYQNNKKGFLIFLLAPLCHFSYWPVFAIALLCYIINPSFKKRLAYVLCGGGIMVSYGLLVFLIDYMNFGDAFMSHIDNYTTGYFAKGELDNHSFLFRLSQLFSILPFYVFSVLAFMRVKNFKNCQLYLCLFLFCILLFNMNSAFNRYASLAIFSFLPFFLMNKDKCFTKKDLNFVYYIAIFVFVTSVYTTKRELKAGDQIDIIKPLPILVLHSYSNSWIDNHIQSNGNMVGND